MLEQATGLLRWVRARWAALGAVQRWLAAGLALAGVLALVFGLALNRTNYVDLAGRLEPKEAAEAVAKLQEMKVPYRLTGDGLTIQVPKPDRYTARLGLAEIGLPRGGTVGMEWFDEPKLGATEFERRVNYLRAQQGELERAIMRMAGVEYSNVKLAIPEQSVFVREQNPVTAAVLVRTRTGQELLPEQVAAIISFVSRSVQGLQPEHVTVVDAAGRTLTPGLIGGRSAQPDLEQTQRETQAQLEQRVQALLIPVFGAGNVVARVNVHVNLDQTRTESRTVLAGPAREVRSERQVDQGRAPGQAEAGAQTQGVPVYQGQEDAVGRDAWKSATTTLYELGEKREVNVAGPGAIRRITAGVAINRPDLAPEQVRQVKDMVAAAVGTTPDSVSVTATSFVTAPAVPVTEPPPPARLPANNPVLWAAVAGALGVALIGVWGARRRPVVEATAAVLPAPAPERAAPEAVRAAPPAANPEGPNADLPAAAGAEAGLRATVTRQIQEDPEQAALVILGWIRGN